MKKAKKVLLLALCAVLLVGATIAGTVAYLTSTTTEVKNTFTAGNVKITLDEAPVDANGKKLDGVRVTANSYKLLPGHEYDKDPTIHVDANSEDCWLFVKVENSIAGIEAEETIAKQLADNGWTSVSGATNVYAYSKAASAGDNIEVFKSFKIKGDITNDVLAAYAGKTIEVTGYAVQKDGFASATDAWAKASATWN